MTGENKVLSPFWAILFPYILVQNEIFLAFTSQIQVLLWNFFIFFSKRNGGSSYKNSENPAERLSNFPKQTFQTASFFCAKGDDMVKPQKKPSPRPRPYYHKYNAGISFILVACKVTYFHGSGKYAILLSQNSAYF